MSDYIGKICPFCKTELQAGDDIVVCSECEMPHHKECWVENQGCTTFGCLGTIKSPDGAMPVAQTAQLNNQSFPSPAANVIFCTKCGARNTTESAFCPHCGNKLTAAPAETPRPPVYTQANPANTNPYSYVNQQNNTYQQPAYQPTSYQQNGYQTYQTAGADAELQQLVGTKTEYYLPKFRELKSQGKQTSWNWPAFLVTPFWLIYRKMYAYGIGALGIAFLVSLFNSDLLTLLLFGGYIAMGILGNSIYLKYLESKVEQAKTLPELAKAAFIAKNSGVDTKTTVLTVIGYVLFFALFA